MREIMLRLAVAMLITTAAFIIVAHPPVAVADLLVAASIGCKLFEQAEHQHQTEDPNCRFDIPRIFIQVNSPNTQEGCKGARRSKAYM